MGLKLTVYDIIRGPIVTEKASKLLNNLKKITFSVHPEATKPMIAEALEKLFNVKVKNIRTSVRKGKIRRFKRIESKGILTKRAIVTLKDSQSFDTLTQQGVGGVMNEQNLSFGATEQTKE